RSNPLHGARARPEAPQHQQPGDVQAVVCVEVREQDGRVLRHHVTLQRPEYARAHVHHYRRAPGHLDEVAGGRRGRSADTARAPEDCQKHGHHRATPPLVPPAHGTPEITPCPPPVSASPPAPPRRAPGRGIGTPPGGTSPGPPSPGTRGWPAARGRGGEACPGR